MVSAATSELARVDTLDRLRAGLSARFAGRDMARIYAGFEISAGRRRPALHAQQRARGFFVPGLEDSTRFDPTRFPHNEDVGHVYARIREEACQLVDGRIEPVPFGASAGGAPLPGNPPGWREWRLSDAGSPAPSRGPALPVASAFADRIAGAGDFVIYVTFQVMGPGVAIDLHVDRHNCFVSWWLPLFVPDGCGLEVGGSAVAMTEGQPLAFDNSYLHRAWNEGPESRVVLSAYVLHPGLTPVERAAIAFLVGSFPDVAAVNRVFDAPAG